MAGGRGHFPLNFNLSEKCFLSEIFLKVQNLGPEIPILGNLGAKLKFGVPRIFSIENSQLSVGKLQLPPLPYFLTNGASVSDNMQFINDETVASLLCRPISYR